MKVLYGYMDPLDIEVLLAHVLKKDRSWILAHPEYMRTHEQESQFKNVLQRRRRGEPVAYIIGEKEFYGRRFLVDPRVLIPRPSTEGLIELVLENVKCKMPARMISGSDGKNEKLQIRKIDTGIVGVFISLRHTSTPLSVTLVDIGTGSGCIAITLACEFPNMRIIATDISPDALEVARENAKRHGVFDRTLPRIGGRAVSTAMPAPDWCGVEFRQGNLLEPIMDLSEPFIIVCNPPYVSEGIPLPPLPYPPPEGEGILHEPFLALFAGHKGTDVLIPLITQARSHPYCQGIFLECQEEQVELLG